MVEEYTAGKIIDKQVITVKDLKEILDNFSDDDYVEIDTDMYTSRIQAYFFNGNNRCLYFFIG